MTVLYYNVLMFFSIIQIIIATTELVENKTAAVRY